MKVYIIRHKPTGTFLPVLNSPSHWNPLESHKSPLRLFNKASAAKAWGTMWAKGPIRVRHFTDFEGNYDSVCEHVPDASRRREDLEVLSATLTIEGPIL